MVSRDRLILVIARSPKGDKAIYGNGKLWNISNEWQMNLCQ